MWESTLKVCSTVAAWARAAAEDTANTRISQEPGMIPNCDLQGRSKHSVMICCCLHFHSDACKWNSQQQLAQLQMTEATMITNAIQTPLYYSPELTQSGIGLLSESPVIMLLLFYPSVKENGLSCAWSFQDCCSSSQLMLRLKHPGRTFALRSLSWMFCRLRPLNERSQMMTEP